jgi:hypothetical protein
MGLLFTESRCYFDSSIYHLDMVTSANVIVSPDIYQSFRDQTRIVRPSTQTRVLTDTSRSQNWIRIRLVRRKPHITGSFYQRCLVVERQSH